VGDTLKDINGFKKNLPLIKVMCNPGLRDRHWEEISKVTPFSIRSDMDLSLWRLIECDLDGQLQKLEDISE
jgi:dynein heavy chain